MNTNKGTHLLNFDFLGANKTKKNVAVVGGVVCSIIVSPFLAGLAVSIGVPILLCYVYGVVPIALCRSEGNFKDTIPSLHLRFET